MNEVVDLNPLIAATQERLDRYEQIRREGLRLKMKHMHNDAERALEYARDMHRAGNDIAEELKEFVAFANSLLLVVGLLERNGGNDAVSEG